MHFLQVDIKHCLRYLNKGVTKCARNMIVYKNFVMNDLMVSRVCKTYKL